MSKSSLLANSQTIKELLDNPQVIKELLANPKSIKENEWVELFQSDLISSSPLELINPLFSLPLTKLYPLLTTQLASMLQSCKGNSEILFLNKLFSIPNQELRDIFNSKSGDALEKALLNPLTNKAIYTKYLATYLNLKPALIEHLTQEQKDNLHPVIQKLLAKTYTNEMSSGFTLDLIKGLETIINSNDLLKSILYKATEYKGNILIVNQDSILNTEKGLFNSLSFDVFVAIGKGNINDALGTLLHELTHKVIMGVLNNKCLPFAKDNTDFAWFKGQIKNELLQEQKAYGELYINEWQKLDLQIGQSLPENILNGLPKKSWLQIMTAAYPENEYEVEILSWLVEQVTAKVLDNEVNKSNVSQEFTQTLWEYLHNTLFPMNSISALPESLFNKNTTLTFENEGTLIADARKILGSSIASINWLDSEAGKLAFQTLSSDIKLKIIEKSFNLPADQLNNSVNKENIITLFQIAEKEKMLVLNELFKLPTAQFNKIINKDNITQLVENARELKLSLVHKLINLPSAQFNNIVDRENINELFENAGKGKFLFINKLLNPTSPELHHLIDDQNIIHLFEHGEEYKGIFLSNLFKISQIHFNKLVNKNNITKLFEKAGEFKAEFLDRLFVLPKEQFDNLVDAKNLKDLINNCGEFNSVLLENLLAIPHETFKSLVTPENGIYIFNISEGEYHIHAINNDIIIDDNIELLGGESFVN